MSAAVSQQELKTQVSYKAVDDYMSGRSWCLALGLDRPLIMQWNVSVKKPKSGEIKKDNLAISTLICTKEHTEELEVAVEVAATATTISTATTIVVAAITVTI
jgi:hypothetical protein